MATANFQVLKATESTKRAAARVNALDAATQLGCVVISGLHGLTLDRANDHLTDSLEGLKRRLHAQMKILGALSNDATEIFEGALEAQEGAD